VTVVLQDLNSHTRSEQALGRLDRLATLGTLSAGIAHEIRNALVVGKTFFDSCSESMRMLIWLTSCAAS